MTRAAWGKTRKEIEELFESFSTEEYTGGFIPAVKKHFGVTEDTLKLYCEKEGIKHLYARALASHLRREALRRLDALGSDLPTDANGRIDPALVSQLDKSCSGYLKFLERFDSDFSPVVKTDTTIRVADPAPLNAVIEKMGGIEKAREILGAALEP